MRESPYNRRPMKAIVITRQGAPVASNVQFVEDYPDPSPGPGEVLVATEAAALNQLDLWVGRGLPGLELTYPRVTGADGCGRVLEVGANVDPAWVGRRVLLNAAVPVPEPAHPERVPAPEITLIGEHSDGCLAERFVAPADNVLDIGEADPVEAAAFGLTFLTAWRMLITRARLRPGQRVLITGIGGGVSQALLAIARYVGCPTIVTSRHQSKLEQARALGADHVVLDTGGDWSREVRGITGGRGVDVVADSVGQAIHVSCIRALARGGVFVTCGCTSGPDARTDLARIFWNQLSVLGSTMGDMGEFREIVSLFQRGMLRPTIDSVHEARNGQAAFERLESSEQFGKVVVRW